MDNMSGDWGHNDWNGNGEHDSYDNMIDFENEQIYYSSGNSVGGKSSGGSHLGWMLLIGCVLSIFNELLGAIFFIFYLWYLIFFT